MAVSPKLGLIDGYDRFMRVIEGAHTLKARLWYLQQEIHDTTVRTLREEVAADADDPLPVLVGGQLVWVQGTVITYIGRELMAGRKAVEVSRDALAMLEEIEDLLSEKVLNYAVRTG